MRRLPSIQQGYALYPTESEYPGIRRGLVGAWVFGMQGGGDRIHDLSRRGAVGTLVNGPSWVSGLYGRAVSFVTNQYMSVAAFPASMVTGGTFACWCYLRSYVNLGGILSSGTAGRLYIQTTSTPGIQFRHLSSAGATEANFSYTGALIPPINKWFHLAVTWDTVSAQLWINGIVAATDTVVSAAYADMTGLPLYLGSYSLTASRYMDGLLDDAYLWTRALSTREMTTISTVPYGMWLLRRPIYAFTVGPEPDVPPTIEDQVGETAFETPLIFDILDDATAGTHAIDPATLDLDPATLGRQITFEDVGKGTYDIDDLGNLTFTPDAGFDGISTCDFTVEDTEGNESNTATITITVLEEVIEEPPPAEAGFVGNSSLYEVQGDVFRGYKNDLEQRLRVALYSYVHDKGSGTGEINIITLPPGRIRVYPHLSTISISQLGAGAVLSLGHRAYTTNLRVIVPQDDIEYLDGIDVAAGITPEAFWALLDSTAYFVEMEYDTIHGLTIYATIESGSIENGDTLDGIIVWARV